MQWLLVFAGDLVKKVFEYYAKRGLVAVGTTITMIGTYLGLYIALCSAMTAAFYALEPVMPPMISFVLSLLPPAAFAMYNAYFVALVGRRVFDWHRRTLKEINSAINSMNY